MSVETFLDGRVTLCGGDSRVVLKGIPDCSIDSIVTDPPYALVSIVKRFGKGGAPVKVPEGGGGAYARASAGFMGKQWDTGETAFAPEFWAECLRVLKPGGHIVAFSGTRTYHRMACAIEDAGFEVRDMLSWLYGSGFPKSHDVMRGMSKQLAGPTLCEMWKGWGAALKPALEPICFGRKSLIGTVAQNVLKHGTGAINVDGCRVDAEKQTGWGGKAAGGNTWNESNNGLGNDGEARPVNGRWPANIIHDGSNEVVEAFPDSDGQQGDVTGKEPSSLTNGIYGKFNGRPATQARGDSGSASRFFYTAKADADDRIGSKHPTVKPVDLMQWLCRLVTPRGGIVLDPFAGTGTTGEAAFREGFNAVLIEREEEYQADIRRRMALCMAGPDERRRESIKAKTANDPVDAGPLFAGAAE